jgi:hypothetical protein
VRQYCYKPMGSYRGALPSRTRVAASRGLVVGLGLLAVLAVAAEPYPVGRGQSPVEVRARLGPPGRVSRQILLGRHVEQWVYTDPRPVWVEFSCVRGDDPYVCAILQLSPARP